MTLRMPLRIFVFRALVLLAAVLAVSACTGGGGGGQGAPSAGEPPEAVPRILRWNPPEEYVDGTALSPIDELDVFEIYLKPGSTPFTDQDVPKACVQAVLPGSNAVTTSFDLSLISATLEPGTYRVSMRTVAKTGVKSSFAPTVTITL